MSRRPYKRPVPRYTWYLHKTRFMDYMVREVSSLFVGAYAALLVIGCVRLAQGPEAWTGFVVWLQSPTSIIFHLLCLGLSLYHTITWFKVAPQAMPLMIGEEKVPAKTILRAHYAAWAAASLVIFVVVGVL